MEKYPQRYLSVLNKADIITCPSSFIIDKLGSYNLKPQLIENTIPLENYPFFNKSELKPVLLWMRAFSDIYNPAMAVRVISELKHAYPDVKLFMGGPDLGALKDMRTLIKEQNLHDNIEIVGFMDLDRKKYYADKADIYISTNKVDNAPVTFIEMWAMGLPIVSTNVGGIPYLAEDGETALLVNDNDHVAMSNKLAELLSSKSIAQKLIQKGKEKSKDYGEDIVFEKWDNHLNAL
jgi:glycosyltransferase involved in cell wall biosynthesis